MPADPQPAPATSVLVVDDEPSFTEALSVGLQREGFEVRTAADGRAALALIRESVPDLVLLDVMLPGMSGIDVCREIRKTSRVPLIMVTARSEEIDAVVGLEVGADDYVAKPYRIRELVARMRAVLRRTASGDDGQPEGPTSESAADLAEPDLTAADAVQIDTGRHEVRLRGELVPLAPREFDLLRYLMNHAGQVVTRESLMANVWEFDYFADTKTIDVHVKRLRSKLEDDPSDPQRIVTVRGLGFRYERL